MKKTILILLISVNLSAQTEISRVGTSGAQFLKLGVSARACALGETMVAVRGDVSGLYWNAAGIASITQKSMLVSRNELYVNLDYNFVGIVLPLSQSSSAGLSALYLNSGDMEVTTIDEPEGTGSYFSWQAYSIGISYARYFTDRLSLGGTLKYVREGAYAEKAHTVALDVGALLDTGVLGFRLGLSMSNIGKNMRFSNPPAPADNDFTETGINATTLLQTRSYPLPLNFRLGLSTDVIGKSSVINQNEHNRLTCNMDACDPNDAFLRANFGMEYEWKELFSLRGGYRGVAIESDPMTDYDTSGFSFGAGIKYDASIVRIQFDYAFVDFSVLGNTHHFSLALSF